MGRTLQYTAVRTSRAFDDLLGGLYMKAKRDPEEIVVPPLRVISVRGNEPPASQQFQRAIAVLYGVGYGLKMGLKFGKLPRPAGYFDYKVGVTYDVAGWLLESNEIAPQLMPAGTTTVSWLALRAPMLASPNR